MKHGLNTDQKIGTQFTYYYVVCLSLFVLCSIRG